MDTANTPPQNTVIEKTPILLIRFEATGVIYEKALAGENITVQNVGRAIDMLLSVLDNSITPKPVEVFPQEVAEAEENLFDGSYWDDMVEAAAREFAEDIEVYEDLEEGNIVDILPSANDFEKFKDYFGEVIKTTEHGVLVDWLGWDGGHDGDSGDGSTSYWWMDPNDLMKV